MPEKNKTVSKDTGYEVKTVEVRDKADSYALMMVRFDGTENEILEDKGFRSNFVVFTVMGSGSLYSTYDPYRLGREFNLDLLESFGLGMRADAKGYDVVKIDWDDVDEGEVIDWDRYEELLQE